MVSATESAPVALNPGAVLVSAQIENDREDWDMGDVVRVRVGVPGHSQVFWVPRALVMQDNQEIRIAS